MDKYRSLEKVYFTSVIWLNIVWICASALGIDVHTALAVITLTISSLTVYMFAMQDHRDDLPRKVNMLGSVINFAWILTTTMLVTGILTGNNMIVIIIRIAMTILTGVYTQFIIEVRN